MIEIAPPYDVKQLEAFAINVDCPPPEGYPALEDRLFLTKDEILERLDGDILWLPPGHDALGSPNRLDAPPEIRELMDPEIVTGSDQTLTPRFSRNPHEKIKDQHGRSVHPGFMQLLSLAAEDGRPLGMPTGIGRFYYDGENDVSDTCGLFRENGDDADRTEMILVRRPGNKQSPKGGWATAGGYGEYQDKVVAHEDPALATARRELFEETGLIAEGNGVIVAQMLPVSSPHTLNSWTRTSAVWFPEENQEYLHDTPLKPGPEVEDAKWFRVPAILNGEVDMWSQDHVLYIRTAYDQYLEHNAGASA
ncbi:MAG TPA: NUDIX hydrolase [Candidatus Saccharimonadales bacterium]|nr:NUDIX hydrolase [Candidatus Saccharimonadales bacterium]